MTRTKTLALIAVGGALVLAGCGGDDDESTTASTAATGATGTSGVALTKEEFITQADAICAQGDEDIETAATEQFGESGQPQNEQEIVDFTDTVVIPSIQSQLDGIALLTPPEGDEEEIEELLTELQAALDELSENPESLADGTSFEDVNQLAADYGFTNCGGTAE